jgi:hypothetical protein
MMNNKVHRKSIDKGVSKRGKFSLTANYPLEVKRDEPHYTIHYSYRKEVHQAVPQRNKIFFKNLEKERARVCVQE